MIAKFEKGQKVVIAPTKSQTSVRDADLEPYAGKTGVITDYYWIQPTGREIFYIYKLRIEDENKEVILHEDELHPYIK